MIAIIQAMQEDIEVIMNMQQALFEKWDKLDPLDKIEASWFGSEEHQKRIMDLLGDVRYRILLAKEGDVVVGYLLGKIHEREPFLQKVGYIEETYVSPDQRGKNIGSLLLDQALEWFKENDLKNAILSTHSLDDEANAFWKKKGFVEFNTTFKMDLD